MEPNINWVFGESEFCYQEFFMEPFFSGHGGLSLAAGPSTSSSSPDSNDSMLIVSGGEGYIDFRIGNT